MRGLAVALSLVMLAVLGAACNGNGDTGAPTAPTTAEPPPTTDGAGELDFDNVQTVAGGLEVPWSIAFAGDGTMLVTERPGRVRVIRQGRLQSEPALELDVSGGEGGLLGIAMHPDYPDERAAFVYYTAGNANRVSRFQVGDDFRLSGEQTVIDDVPASRVHNGGHLAFGPDGLLYVGTGDAGEPDLAADDSSLGGKILRIDPEGGRPEVFSSGHRNVQGFDWDGGGRLYVSEHGPSGERGMCCHDEVNLVEEGGFYGWPHRAGDVSVYPGTPPAEPVDPVAASGEETWAPAGLAVQAAVDDDGPAALYVAMLRGQGLLRFDVDPTDPRAVSEPAAVLDGLGRLRAAAFGPDGCLYLTTSNRDGRGNPTGDDDRILRACPEGD